MQLRVIDLGAAAIAARARGLEAVVAETAARTREGKGTCVGALAPDVAVKE